MKKGCFIKAIFFIILIIGIGYHLYTDYGREFLEDSKDDLISLAYESLLDEIEKIPDSDYADSLKDIVNAKFEQIHGESIEHSQEEIEKVLNSIEDLLEDNDLEIEEYEKIKKIIEDYERSAKIRD